jgi:hypothetical protein
VACSICGKPILGEEGVVRDWGGSVGYERFYEDLRASGYKAEYHPICYGEAHGVRALMELIHRRNVIDRGRTGS